MSDLSARNLVEMAAGASRKILAGDPGADWQPVLDLIGELRIDLDLASELVTALAARGWAGKHHPAGWIRTVVLRNAQRARVREMRHQRRCVPLKNIGNEIFARD